jgi:hypothetical protein
MPFWSAPVQMEEADAVPLEIPNEQSIPNLFFLFFYFYVSPFKSNERKTS